MHLFLPFAIAAVAVVAAMTLVWLISVRRADASIVDVAWGLAFVGTAWIYHAFGEGPAGAQQWLLLGLVTIWGTRLSAHIFLRNRGHGEDRRYAAMRARGGDGWWWRSLFLVFYLQAALVLVIGAPLLVALASADAAPWHWSAWAGGSLWLVGFVFEAGGDFQLARFTADPANRGKVLAAGLWRLTRHPNYFGDAVQWWGYWLLAWAAPLGPWTVWAPAIMTLLLLKVSGVSLLERDIAERRPAYRDYIRRTNAFFPGPPKPRAPNGEAP